MKRILFFVLLMVCIHYWQDMFNIEIDWQIPPQGSEAEQMSLMLGTGDYTDIMDMSFNTENLGTLCDDGVIYDLTPYLDECMPNYKAWLDANPDVKSALFDDSGRIYLASHHPGASQAVGRPGVSP